MKLILGSSSKWRALIMREMGYDFEVISPDVDEKAIRHSSPQVLTLALARAKSEALRARLKEPAVIVTSDQVVTCQGLIREKPEDAGQAREFLRSYREYPAVCVTAVVVCNTATGYDAAVVDEAEVYFKNLTDEAIERIVSEGSIMGCAGAFAAAFASEPTICESFIERIDGERESVVGLPRRKTGLLIQDAMNS